MRITICADDGEAFARYGEMKARYEGVGVWCEYACPLIPDVRVYGAAAA